MKTTIQSDRREESKHHHQRLITLLFLAAISLFTFGCNQDSGQDYTPTVSTTSSEQGEPLYIFSIHPLHNPTRLHEIFGPLMAYLSDNIDNARFQLEASRNYASYDAKLYGRQAHFSLPNPFQTINALKHGYRVFGKMGDDFNFRGIILVRKDSGIHDVSQLKGKAVSYPAPTALAATMLPQYYLQTHGLDVMHDIENRYVGSQESSIMNVYLGNTAAAATWPPPWNAMRKERPELERELEVKWQTQSLPNNGLVVRDDVPEDLVRKVGDLLFNLHKTENGRRMLEKMELSRFEPATDDTYRPVVQFIEDFKKNVRPVD